MGKGRTLKPITLNSEHPFVVEKLFTSFGFPIFSFFFVIYTRDSMRLSAHKSAIRKKVPKRIYSEAYPFVSNCVPL